VALCSCSSEAAPGRFGSATILAFSEPRRGVLDWLARLPVGEELKAESGRLRAENESLKKPARGRVSLKVGEKGALSVYGLDRFPVKLYREPWGKLPRIVDEIRIFIRENDVALKKKK
jgi:hypothetical protein